LLLLVLCLGWFLLPLREWIEVLQSWLLGLGLSGVMIFAMILIVVTFLPAPDWPLPIAAGYVYGFWAFPLTYASIAFASVLAFLAARYLLRDKIRLLLNRRRKYRTLDRAVADDGWKVVVLMRLSPVVPFNLQNYALGVTAIPFTQYLTATLIGIVPGIAIYVYFGIFGKVREWTERLRLGVIRAGSRRDHSPGDPGDQERKNNVRSERVISQHAVAGPRCHRP